MTIEEIQALPLSRRPLRVKPGKPDIFSGAAAGS
jgi:hypothetical protein